MADFNYDRASNDRAATKVQTSVASPRAAKAKPIDASAQLASIRANRCPPMMFRPGRGVSMLHSETFHFRSMKVDRSQIDQIHSPFPRKITKRQKKKSAEIMKDTAAAIKSAIVAIAHAIMTIFERLHPSVTIAQPSIAAKGGNGASQ
jgi:hypothetical protein